jgi:hypothetical protein
MRKGNSTADVLEPVSCETSGRRRATRQYQMSLAKNETVGAPVRQENFCAYGDPKVWKQLNRERHRVARILVHAGISSSSRAATRGLAIGSRLPKRYEFRDSRLDGFDPREFERQERLPNPWMHQNPTLHWQVPLARLQLRPLRGLR